MDNNEALLLYLEFNLIGMVNTLKPYIREDVDITEVYEHANEVLEEMRRSMKNPTGMTTETS